MRHKILAIALFNVITVSLVQARVPSMIQNDTYPLFKSSYPYGFLNEQTKEAEKGDTYLESSEHMRIHISPYVQKAQTASDHNKQSVPAGDIYGRWNMIGLLYGAIPAGHTQTADLTTAAAQTYQDGQRLDHVKYTDVKDELGHFSVPVKYRKAGVRFSFQTRIINDVIISVESGIADLKQTMSLINDMNATKSQDQAALANYMGSQAPANITSTLADINTVETYLMDPYKTILQDLGYNIDDFNETGAEDTYVSLTWRHNFFGNEDLDEKEWPPFIFTPFFTVTGIIATGKTKDQAKIFSLPFGNNGHHGVNLTCGLSIDFFDSLEISCAAGTSHFFEQNVSNVFLPTNQEQTGIFPYKTDVKWDPGKTWSFSAGFNAYHFKDKLSFWGQYTFTAHHKDTITVLNGDTAFKPEVFALLTAWKVQAANLGFTYDISPSMMVGLVWQAPIARRGAYKTNTLLLSLAGTF